MRQDKGDPGITLAWYTSGRAGLWSLVGKVEVLRPLIKMFGVSNLIWWRRKDKEWVRKGGMCLYGVVCVLFYLFPSSPPHTHAQVHTHVHSLTNFTRVTSN